MKENDVDYKDVDVCSDTCNHDCANCTCCNCDEEFDICSECGSPYGTLCEDPENPTGEPVCLCYKCFMKKMNKVNKIEI